MTRYDRCPTTFLSAIALAALVIHYESWPKAVSEYFFRWRVLGTLLRKQSLIANLNDKRLPLGMSAGVASVSLSPE